MTFFFSSRRRHTRWPRDWSSDVCSSDLRAGLLRTREFVMKDAYSFDIDDAGLDASYERQRKAYQRTFERLGLPTVICQADAGAMGGSRSEEFLHPTEVGEDTFVEIGRASCRERGGRAGAGAGGT